MCCACVWVASVCMCCECVCAVSVYVLCCECEHVLRACVSVV